jgi:AcrR family transcriptional regulator
MKASGIKTENKKIRSAVHRGGKRASHEKRQSIPSEQRRLDIMKAALQVFGEKGFQKAKIDDIAVRAGVAHGTIYLYFPSKSAIATELIGIRGATYFLESLLDDHSLQDPDPTGLLQTIVQKYFGNLEERLPLMRFRIAESFSHPDLGREYYNTLLHRLILDLGHFIQVYQKSGALKAGDSFIYGHIFYGIMFTFLYCQELLHGKDITNLDLQKIIPQIVDVFLHGVASDQHRQ